MMSGLLLYIQANPLVGTGSLLRSLDLARQWKAEGGEVYYVVGQLPATLLRRIAITGCEIIKPSGPQAANELAKTLWRIAGKKDCDWLATCDARKDLIGHIGAERPETRNYLVMGSPTQEAASHSNLVTGLEPSFVLLRPNHSNAPLPKVAPKRAVRRVIVDSTQLGSNLSAGLVRRICHRFKESPHYFDIVTPFAASAANQLHEQNHPIRRRITWHRNADRVFATLYGFDLAVTADPANFFEFAHSEMPGILLSGKTHPSNRFRDLGKLTTNPWWLENRGTHKTFVNSICDQIEAFCSDSKMLAQHREEMKKLVDQHGATRLTMAMKNLAKERAGKAKTA